MTDRFGRRRLFMLTLVTYMSGVLLTGLAWNWPSFAAFRFLTGFAIGGEYAAIDELIPARVRGWVDLAINGSYWMGAMVSASLSILYLDKNIVPEFWSWRIAFWTGLTLAVALLVLRRNVPESPRWLMTHAHEDEAERITDSIERQVGDSTGVALREPGEDRAIELRQRKSIGFVTIARTAFKVYPQRSVLGFSLM